MKTYTKLAITIPLVATLAACGGGGEPIIEAEREDALVDTDNDGVVDTLDAFPRDATETLDTDSDGVGDNADAFPRDATETLDTDSDGVGDNADAFPRDATETLDTDSDGVGDNADPLPNISGTNLATLADNETVQIIALSGNSIDISNQAKSASDETITPTLSYVALTESGKIVGIPADRMPRGVTFYAEDTANVYVLIGGDAYTLTNGAVDAAIDGTSGDLSVLLSFNRNNIAFTSEADNSLSVNTNMQVSVDSTLSGVSECGSANLLCGGTLNIIQDNTIVETATMAPTEFITGIYGTASDPDIGGVVNYVDEGTLAAKGSFIAARD